MAASELYVQYVIAMQSTAIPQRPFTHSFLFVLG